MAKKEFIHYLKKESGVPLYICRQVFDAMGKAMADYFIDGDDAKIVIPHLGTFSISYVPETNMSLNFTESKEKVVVPAKYKLRYVPSHILTNALKEKARH